MLLKTAGGRARARTLELADKELATKDLIAFTEYTFGRYGTALDYPSYDAMARPRM